jgi:3-oxoacyl-[acyl-carrier protein] reductase
MSEENPVVVITGTSQGIGASLVRYFLNKGYLVEGCSRGGHFLNLPGYGYNQVDVRDEEAVSQWVRGIKRKHGRIDVVVNNAGFAPAAIPALMTSGEMLRDVLETNTMGSYFVSREAALVMMKRQFGRIINVSSMAVGLHEEGTAAYSASKNAIVEFTRIMAKELAPFNITCNVIAPSMIKTEAVEALGAQVIERALNKLTIKRMITIDEIGHVLDFFIEPSGGIITGQVVYMGLISS